MSPSNQLPPIAQGLNRFANALDTFNAYLGKTLSWLCLVMAIVVGLVLLLRAFNIGSIALQESVTYMHATLFLLCFAYTARENGHVRVDIWYRKATETQKAWVDIVGTILFLLPFSLFITYSSWELDARSWAIGEVSSNPGGIPAVFLLKSLIPLSGGLLTLHACSEVIRKLLQLTFIFDEQKVCEK